MEILHAFPNIEDFFLDLLSTVGSTVLSTPELITPPLVVVRRTGGNDDYLTDIPRIQIDTFGADHRHAADLAEACRQLILASPATGSPVSIDDAWTESAPAYVAYGDRNSQRYVATYRIALRRVR